GWLVFAVQGMIIFSVGLGITHWFARFECVSAGLQPEFYQLIFWQCVQVLLTFLVRIFYLILNANQRMDLANYTSSLTLGLGFFIQWFFFARGLGMLSFPVSGIISGLVALGCQVWACYRFQLLPDAGCWGRPSWRQFRHLFDYCKDVFFIALGNQLIIASQPFIIKRLLGAEAVGLWGTGLKSYTLLNQLVWRISDMSQVAFADMLARGEAVKLRRRYHDVAASSFAIAGWAAVTFALCNHLFVPLWTHGRFQWQIQHDILLAIWLLQGTVVHCHSNVIIMTKEFKFFRFIFFIEGLCFVSLAYLFAPLWGLSAVILCSIFCTLIFSLGYSVFRVQRYFGYPLRELLFDWFKPTAKLLALYLPIAGLMWFLLRGETPWQQLLVHATLTAAAGFWLLLRYGLPVSVQQEIKAKIPARFTGLARYLFAPGS
ncbi:MAG TPA: oligosaccharide flippase family protein, partial [Verrucomicrobiae bacterium]